MRKKQEVVDNKSSELEDIYTGASSSELDSIHETFMKKADRTPYKDIEQSDFSKRDRFMDLESTHRDPRIDRALAYINNQSKGRLQIDPKIVPPGFVYGWRVETIHGKTIGKAIQESYNLGWVPVPSSDHPDMVTEEIKELDTSVDFKFIRRDGLILMKRSKELNDAELNYYNAKTQNKIDAMSKFSSGLTEGGTISFGNSRLTNHHSFG